MLENKEGALQIRFPHPYSYREKKFDIFAPHLIANRERFFWQSYVKDEKPVSSSVSISGDFQSYLSVKIFPLIKNSEAAIKQFEESIRLQKRADKLSGMARAHNKLGRVYLLQGDFL